MRLLSQKNHKTHPIEKPFKNLDVTLTPHNDRWRYILNQLSETESTEKS